MINLLNPIRLPAGCKQSLCFVVFAVYLGHSTNAAARITFPAEIQKDLSLSSAPVCTICHTTPAGGIGTATTDFAVAMKAAGMTIDISTLAPALAALNQTHPEYIQALEAGLDPNTGVKSVPAERYGCGARISTGSLRHGGELSIALATLVLGLLVHWQRMLNRNRPGR